jgi:hypothetical protein
MFLRNPHPGTNRYKQLRPVQVQAIRRISCLPGGRKELFRESHLDTNGTATCLYPLQLVTTQNCYHDLSFSIQRSPISMYAAPETQRGWRCICDVCYHFEEVATSGTDANARGNTPQVFQGALEFGKSDFDRRVELATTREGIK